MGPRIAAVSSTLLPTQRRETTTNWSGHRPDGGAWEARKDWWAKPTCSLIASYLNVASPSAPFAIETRTRSGISYVSTVQDPTPRPGTSAGGRQALHQGIASR